MITAAALAAGCGGAPAPQPSPNATSAAPGGAAACTAPARMPDLGRTHITSLNYSYPQHPATSGPHYGEWMMPPPQVFSTSPPETRLVHNLEHGYVVVYYSPGPASPLPDSIVRALAAKVTGQRKVLMAPYEPLPAGQALAFAAWDELQTCGAAVSADEAANALTRFIAVYREGPLAPEPQAP